MRADWIAVARFDTHDAAAVIAALGDLTGARRVRYGTRGPNHPRNPTFRPRGIVVTEWDQRPTLDWGRLSPFVADLEAFVGERVYPWPDHGKSRRTEIGQ